MKSDINDFKIISAIALGAIGGLLLGNLIWGRQGIKTPLSKHVSTLSKILKQIEGMNTEEAEDLKNRIHSILKTIESNYGDTKEKGN